MNTSTIINLVNNDPSILDNTQGFIDTMNDKTIKRVVSTKTIVEDVVEFISIADQNGGECTQRNIDDALFIMKQQPLFEEAKKRADAVFAAIQTGDAKTADDMAATFKNADIKPAIDVVAVPDGV